MQTRVVELIPQLLDEGFTEELLVVNDDLNNAFIRYERYAAENASQLRQCSSSSIAFCFFRTYRNAIGFQVRQIEQSADDECSAGKQTAWAVLAWVVKAWNCDVFFWYSYSFRAPLRAQTSRTWTLSLHLSTSLLSSRQPANQQATPQPIRRNHQIAVSKLCITPSTVLQHKTRTIGDDHMYSSEVLSSVLLKPSHSDTVTTN